MAHVELPQEELQPLIMSMKRVFAPFVEAIPSIVRIPQEVERLTETIKRDVKSGQPDRFVSGSKKSADSVDMIGMMRTYIDSNTDEGKKRIKDLEDLERIAQERAKAEADLEKVLQTGTPAEITEDNKVKKLNEKEIIEKQKLLLKTQSDSALLEQKLIEEKGKGEDTDVENLIRLQEALENNNTLLQEQTEVLGDRLPRQKVKQTVGARDFIPGPLMDAYEEISETAKASAKAVGSMFQPLIGLKKLFTTQKDYEEEQLADKEAQDNKLGLSVIVTTLKFIGLSLALAVLLKAVYDLAKKFGFISDLPEEQQRKKIGMFGQESDDAYKKRLIHEEGLSAVEAGKIVRENTNEFDNPIDYLLKDSKYGTEEVEIAKDEAMDKRLYDEKNMSDSQFLKRFPGKSGDSSPLPFGNRNRNRKTYDGYEDLKNLPKYDLKSGSTVNIVTSNKSETKVVATPIPIRANEGFNTDAIKSIYNL